MRFLLLSSSGQYSCLESLHKELKERKHKVVAIQECDMKDEDKYKKNLHSKGFDAVILTDYKFTKYSRYKDNSNPIVSTVHHGLGLKYPVDFIDGYLEKNRVDIVFVSGGIYYDTLKKNKDRSKDVYLTGFPKTDYLVNNKDKQDLFREIVKKKYKISNNKPIILYAPTWSRRSYSYGTLGSFESIVKQCNDEFNIIVAPHPSDISWFNSNIDIKKYKDICACFDVNKSDIILGSDLVLSDNSSIAMEAALVDKPVIHLVNFYAPETMLLHITTGYPKVRVGKVVSIPDEIRDLRKTIYKSIANDSYDLEKKYWVSRFCSGCNGHSTNKVIDILEMRIIKRGLDEDSLD